MLKSSELRAKNPAELQDMLVDLRKEQFNLRMQHGSGTLNEPHELKRVRRDIARIKTALNQTQDTPA